MSEASEVAASATRRTVLTGCLAGCSAALAGCASYGTPAAPASAPGPVPADPGSAPASDPAAPAASDPASDPGAEGAAEPAGPALAALDDIPVGGALILADAGVVLVRPDQDTVHGLSATCTHAGCAVATVKGDTVRCPCHGSRFSLADGSVQRGPAVQPLDRVTVRVVSGQVLPA